MDLYFENNDHMSHMFSTLREHGFNGVVFATTSLKHAMQGEESDERHFLNLAHLELAKMEETTFAIFILEEDKLAEIKEIIRKETNHFKDMKGGMYSRPVPDFEGSI